MSIEHAPTREIGRIKAVKKLTGYSESAIRIKSSDPDDDFPAGLILGPHALGWYMDEIRVWQGNRRRTKTVPSVERAAA